MDLCYLSLSLLLLIDTLVGCFDLVVGLSLVVKKGKALSFILLLLNTIQSTTIDFQGMITSTFLLLPYLFSSSFQTPFLTLISCPVMRSKIILAYPFYWTYFVAIVVVWFLKTDFKKKDMHFKFHFKINLSFHPFTGRLFP